MSQVSHRQFDAEGEVVAIGREDTDAVLVLALRPFECLGAGEGQRIVEHPLVGLVRTGDNDQKESPDNEARDAGYCSSSARKVHAPPSTTASSAGLRFEQIAS